MKITVNNVAQNTEKSKNNDATAAADTAAFEHFDAVKRAFEKAYASGADYTEEITALATAIAKSVLNKVIDPQRKTAGEKSTVSNSGVNRYLDDLKRGIYFDSKNLANIRHWSNIPYEIEYTKDGDMTLVEDKAASIAFDTLLDYCLTEGIDLVHAAVVALLEQAADHAASGEGWLDEPFTVKRLSKRVYIRESDSRAYKEIDTTAIQECYRAVRRAIAQSRAVQTDPRNGYTYISIDAYEPEQLEQIFIRSGKYADVGGTDCNGLYTGDYESLRAANSAEEMLASLNLTARELQIIKLRMRGYSVRAIAEYLGVRVGTITNLVKRTRDKAREIGFGI